MEQLTPGEIIAGRFRIDKKLGQGGMGAVYRATQTGLARGVAVKILKSASENSQKVRKRFEREAHVLAALRHPGAVQIYDFGEHEGQLYIVMELLIGESLEDRLARPLFTLEQKYKIIRDVADVLVATHDIALVHRDVKPDNIFMEDTADGQERAKLVDFGLAFIAEQGELGRVTRDGLVSGTPQYASPEQAMDKKLTSASDVYSLGVVFFRLLTGQLPFSGSLGELVSSHIYATPPRVRSFVKNVPSSVEDLVAQMMGKTPEERPSAKDVRQLLDNIKAGQVAPERSRSAPRPKGPLGDASSESATVDMPAAGSTEVLGEDFSEFGGRKARQLAKVSSKGKDTKRFSDRTKLGVVGVLDAGIRLSLATRGIDVCEVGTKIPDDIDVLLTIGVTPKSVSKWVKSAGVPVVADAEADALERGTDMLRAGAADVVSSPLEAEPVARKIERVARRALRRKSKEQGS